MTATQPAKKQKSRWRECTRKKDRKKERRRTSFTRKIREKEDREAEKGCGVKIESEESSGSVNGWGEESCHSETFPPDCPWHKMSESNQYECVIFPHFTWMKVINNLLSLARTHTHALVVTLWLAQLQGSLKEKRNELI